LTWLGTAEQYLAQLKVMHRAVKEADPAAMVVLGGATYALPASAADSAERQFYTIVLGDGRDAFDVFDLHLYGPAEQILTDIEGARSMMLAFGYQKPLLVGEYNAPWPNLYPEALAAMEETMAAVEGGGDPRRTPEEAAIANLYERMVNLPLELQMFMRGCPPELDAKRDRINCREIVMRNLLALSAGVSRTVCWNLAPEIPGYENRLSIMDLLFGKFALLDYGSSQLRIRHPSANTFALLAEQLSGVEGVTRLDPPDQQDLFLFEVRRGDRGPLLVVWRHADSFTGEDEPPVAFEWPWPSAPKLSAPKLSAPEPLAIDAFGQEQPVDLRDGRLRAQVSVTPLFVTAD
jgi:hypothetical protein